MPDWIWEVDAEGRFRYSNSVVREMLGIPPDELAERTIFDLLASEDTTRCHGVFDTAIADRCEFRNVVGHFVGRDGSIKTLEVSCVPILKENRIIGLRGISRDITDRLLLQRVAEEALANYRAALDNSPAGIAIIQNENVVYANPKMLELMGYTIQETGQLDLWQMIHPDDREKARDYYHRRIAGLDSPDEYEIRVITRSGEPRRFELRATVITYQGAPAVLDNVVDVTEQRRDAERLAKLNECFLSFDSDAMANINRLTAVAGELMGADCALYNRLDEGMLCSWGMWNAPRGYDPVSRPEGHICHDVIKGGRDGTTVVRNLPETPYADTDPNIRPYRLRTYVGHLVRLGGTAIGSICCIYQSDYAPSEEDEKLLGIIAAAVAVEEERRFAEIEVRASEQRLRDRYEAIATGLIVYDAQGTITYVNKAVSDILEIPQENLIGRLIFAPGWQAFTEDGSPLPNDERPTLIALRTGKPARSVVASVGVKGGRRWVMVSAIPLFDRNTRELVEILATFVDITDRKHAEQQIAEAEAKYRSLVEESLVGVYIIQDTGFAYVNPRCAEIFGYTQEEMLLHPDVVSVVAPEDRELVESNLRRRLLGETLSMHYSFKGVRKDGSLIDVEVLGSRTVLDGKPAVIGSILDVTDRKRSEQALRESEERYRLLFERSPDMVLVLQNGRITAVNPAVTRVLGYQPEEVIGMHPWQLSPEFQPDGTSSESKAAEIQADLYKAGLHSFEWLHQRKDGVLVDCDVSLTVYRTHGQVFVQSITRDITERKRAEEHRRALERQLETQKRQFYRETILSVTGGKLDICEAPEMRPYISNAQLRITVRGAVDVAGARREVEHFLREQGLEGERLDSFMIGVGEAITNAVKHASGGRVYAGVRGDTVWASVADRGSGISSLILPRATLLRGFSTKPSLGLGYTIMLEVADRILLRTGEHGTTVILVKDLVQAEPQISSSFLPDTWENMPQV